MPIPDKQNKIKRISTKERVYKVLCEWIVNGTLKPEERLNDKELAEYFAVSRMPVREALQMLVEQKFVTVAPSSGTFVAPLDCENMVQVYQMIAGLQCLALELAFDSISSDDIACLFSLNAKFTQLSTTGDALAANLADAEFHRQIAILSHNDYLVHFTDMLALQAQRGENLYFLSGVRRASSYEQHTAIIEALRNGNLKVAQEVMKQNWPASFWKSPLAVEQDVKFS